ncbi:MAG: SAM-dependent chlorinase/fluorinase [Candidatus Korarchaeota archaeon]
MVSGIVTLITDFTEYGPHVGIIKGVILKTFPECIIVDVTHFIPPFSIPAGAFVLRESFEAFPEGTVHLAVVDPTVGSKRRCIALRTRNYWFVGPDNGILWPAAAQDKILSAWEINAELFPHSMTFHGRDIFAPVAARLSRGESVDTMAHSIEINKLTKLDLSNYAFADQFGNIETPLKISPKEILLNGKKIRLVKTYADGAQGEIFALINSRGFLELASKEDSAYDKIKNKDALQLEIDGIKYAFKIISLPRINT